MGSCRPLLVRKKKIAPGYYSRKYGMRVALAGFLCIFAKFILAPFRLIVFWLVLFLHVHFPLHIINVYPIRSYSFHLIANFRRYYNLCAQILMLVTWVASSCDHYRMTTSARAKCVIHYICTNPTQVGFAELHTLSVLKSS